MTTNGVSNGHRQELVMAALERVAHDFFYDCRDLSHDDRFCVRCKAEQAVAELYRRTLNPEGAPQ